MMRTMKPTSAISMRFNHTNANPCRPAGVFVFDAQSILYHNTEKMRQKVKVTKISVKKVTKRLNN